MTTSRLRAASLLAAFALAVAACGGSAASPAPTTTPAPTVAPTPAPTEAPTPTAAPTDTPTASAPVTGGRTGRIEVADSGFAVTLADGWTEVPLDEDDIEAIVEAIPDESIAEQLRAQLPFLLQAGVKLWAFDLSADASGGNLIVITQPGIIPVSLLKTVAEQGVAQVPGIEGDIAVDDITLDDVDGVVVSYTVVQQGASLDQRQIYVATNEQTYIFTFTDPGGTQSAALDAMIESIEFLP